MEAARNPTGRPNADVLRRFVAIQAGGTVERIRIDFPLQFNAREAALYVRPFAHLNAALPTSRETVWLNPYAQPALRTAIARLDRYLATPLAVEAPEWNWIESDILPEADLLVVARDDDYIRGLLQSRFFAAWWRIQSPALSPAEIVTSFPFPWPPATLLGALSRGQEDHRYAISRAIRADEQSRLDAAVAGAYGWPGDLEEEEATASLGELSRQRASVLAD